MNIEFYRSPGGPRTLMEHLEASAVPLVGDVVVIRRQSYKVTSVGWVIDSPNTPDAELVANVFLKKEGA